MGYISSEDLEDLETSLCQKRNIESYNQCQKKVLLCVELTFYTLCAGIFYIIMFFGKFIYSSV